jgi:hypothetical protein
MNILLVKLLILLNLISYLYTIIHNIYKYILYVIDIDIMGHMDGSHSKSVLVRPVLWPGPARPYPFDLRARWVGHRVGRVRIGRTDHEFYCHP